MKHLRLVADDLTGALDTAAQFAGPGRAIPVFLQGTIPETILGDLAVDAATRECDGSRAVAAAERWALILAPDPSAVSYKKVDSLLRGHPGLELAATLRAAPVTHCVIAPAFPAHGRVTRAGRQFSLNESSGAPVGDDLQSTLLLQGLPVSLKRPGDAVPEGISLWDAQTDQDLRVIAGAGASLPGPVLWCGSGGLAAAIAGPRPKALPAMARPTIGIFGSRHPATRAQLAACGGNVLTLDGGGANARQVSARLEGTGVCLLDFALGVGISRQEATRRIADTIDRLVRAIPRPGGVVVAGGETLRALCLSLGTGHLEVWGELEPGIPVSAMVGGRWDGVRVVSKSGAFGDETLLLRIVSTLA